MKHHIIKYIALNMKTYAKGNLLLSAIYRYRIFKKKENGRLAYQDMNKIKISCN